LQSATETIELFQHVRQLIGRNATGQDLALRNRFKTVMDDDLNTPEAIHLLKNAAETVVTSHDTDTGIELLHLTTVLGLCI
jgi:cysteinyl-tRNA synthetase